MKSKLVTYALLLALTACEKGEDKLPFLAFLELVEVSESAGKAEVMLSLDAKSKEEITLKYNTIDGTANYGPDYDSVGMKSIVFKPGETSKVISVSIINDNEYEADEYFFLAAGGLRNATLGNDRTRIVIKNDDLFIPVLQIPERLFFDEGTALPLVARVPVRLSGPAQVPVLFRWSTVQWTARAGEDFAAVTKQLVTFSPGETEKMLEVGLVNDNIFEMDDQFTIELSAIENATATGTSTKIVILNDDTYSPEMAADGPVTPMSYPQMYLSWSDEFNGTAINPENWGYNIGGGGWGNNELQVYTNSSQNSYLQDGKLHITATKLYNSYNSARLITQGKREFRYGRIDIRAKLPIGKGIWPALWMLGANFSTVGWPRCGEIDIMEYLGHEPWKVHGSIHYFDGGHKSRTKSYTLATNDNFNDKFHVFSIVWQENAIRWYVDYQLYHEIKDTDIKFESFRLAQFFIFNVAVGGNWPGNPDATTVFPQTMIVDYVRVFQVPEN